MNTYFKFSFLLSIILILVLVRPAQAGQLSSRVNEAFRGIFGRNPSQAENQYWLGRIGPNDKNTFPALQGAMAYHMAQGKTIGAAVNIRPLISRVNEAFRGIFGRNPSQAENQYWLGRIGPNDKNTFSELQGAMAYHRAQGKTVGNVPGRVAGMTIPRATDDRQDLIRVVLPLFFHLYGNDPAEHEKAWWRQRISCNEITTYEQLVVSMAYHKHHGSRLGAPTICGQRSGIIQRMVEGLENHPMGPHIRVGIYSTNGSAIRVTSNGTFQIRDGKSNSHILHTVNADQIVEISWTNGKYHIKGPGIDRTVSQAVRLVPLNMAVMELVDFTDDSSNVPGPARKYNRFRGVIEVRKCEPWSNSNGRVFQCNQGGHGSNSLWAINELRVEYYVRGLAETSGTGPIEYLKALGTAARTYALYHLIVTGGRYPAEGFDLRNTPNDQLYRGYEFELDKQRMAAILGETRGVVITNRNSQLVVPIYSSGTQGQTRVFPDPAPRFAHLHHSVDDPYGHHPTSCGTGGNHCYGMSARGAVGFARHEGWSFQKILEYYYKGVQLVRGY